MSRSGADGLIFHGHGGECVGRAVRHIWQRPECRCPVGIRGVTAAASASVACAARGQRADGTENTAGKKGESL